MELCAPCLSLANLYNRFFNTGVGVSHYPVATQIPNTENDCNDIDVFILLKDYL